jgi:hypothetical protein
MQIVKLNEFKITKLMFKGYKQDRFGVVDGIITCILAICELVID